MSKEVLRFLKNENLKPQEQYNLGLSHLMNAASGSNLVRSYNNRGYSPENLKNLKYDLMNTLGLKAADLRNFVDDEPVTEIVQQIGTALTPSEFINDFVEKNKDRKVMKIITGLPDEVKAGIKLYGKYEFLRSKDCPNEFKILTADAITAFENYKTGHKELFDKVAALADPVLTDYEIFAVACQVLEDFELNHEIHAELQHYQDTGEILGKHSIFADLMLERELEALTPAALAKKHTNYKTYVSKASTALDANKDSEKVEELQADLDKKTKVRDLVKKLLDKK